VLQLINSEEFVASVLLVLALALLPATVMKAELATLDDRAQQSDSN
jgi:hypothetical protein